jgi:hypothetical protein
VVIHGGIHHACHPVTTVVSVVPFLVFAFGEHGTVGMPFPMRPETCCCRCLSVLAYLTAVLSSLPRPHPWWSPDLPGTCMRIGLSCRRSLAADRAGADPDRNVARLRFRREVLTKLPALALSGLASPVMCVAAALARGAGAASGLRLDEFLALAPAAVTEMVITAQAKNVRCADRDGVPRHADRRQVVVDPALSTPYSASC